jgi:hypothetical protein
LENQVVLYPVIIDFKSAGASYLSNYIAKPKYVNPENRRIAHSRLLLLLLRMIYVNFQRYFALYSQCAGCVGGRKFTLFFRYFPPLASLDVLRDFRDTDAGTEFAQYK